MHISPELEDSSITRGFKEMSIRVILELSSSTGMDGEENSRERKSMSELCEEGKILVLANGWKVDRERPQRESLLLASFCQTSFPTRHRGLPYRAITSVYLSPVAQQIILLKTETMSSSSPARWLPQFLPSSEHISKWVTGWILITLNSAKHE